MTVIKENYSFYGDRTKRLPFLDVPQNKKLLYYATSAGAETLKSDYVMERHDINIYMINYIVRGSAKLTVEGKEYDLRQGDLTFLHLAKHSVLGQAADGTEIFYFHVLGGQLPEIYDAYTQNCEYVAHNVPKELLEKAFAEFVDAVENDKGFYERSRILYGLLTEILRYGEKEAQNKYPKIIDRILCYILYDCPPPTPAAVAAEFNFSPVYLERLFKRHTGESVQQYILKQKYAFACRYLNDSDMSIEEIARKVGYADSKGLIALFSKFGDLTPLAYRKKMRQSGKRT